jgi:hypothetical protein
MMIYQKMMALLLLRIERDTSNNKGGWVLFKYKEVMLHTQLRLKEIMRAYFVDKNLLSFFNVKIGSILTGKEGLIRYINDGTKDRQLWPIAQVPIEVHMNIKTPAPGGPTGSWGVNDLYSKHNNFFKFPGAMEAWVRAMIDLQTERHLFSTNKELHAIYLEAKSGKFTRGSK